jgi:hypothetical protein
MSDFGDAKSISKMIRDKKKNKLRPDLDEAGQEGVDPNAAWDAKLASEVNDTLDMPDHEPASEAEMGENESSQDKTQLKKAMARLNKYFESL